MKPPSPELRAQPNHNQLESSIFSQYDYFKVGYNFGKAVNLRRLKHAI